MKAFEPKLLYIWKIFEAIEKQRNDRENKDKNIQETIIPNHFSYESQFAQQK